MVAATGLLLHRQSLSLPSKGRREKRQSVSLDFDLAEISSKSLLPSLASTTALTPALHPPTSAIPPSALPLRSCSSAPIWIGVSVAFDRHERRKRNETRRKTHPAKHEHMVEMMKQLVKLLPLLVLLDRLRFGNELVVAGEEGRRKPAEHASDAEAVRGEKRSALDVKRGVAPKVDGRTRETEGILGKEKGKERRTLPRYDQSRKTDQR
jgi:hypothetical protein